MKKYIVRLLSFAILIFLISGCTRTIYMEHCKPILIRKERDRNQSIFFKKKVDKYFEKWYKESLSITDGELSNQDSITRMGYEIYTKFMSDTALLKDLYVNKKYEYTLVPNKIGFLLINCSNLDSCLDFNIYGGTQSNEIREFEIRNFKPQIENHKCLYYTEKYRKHFPKYSLRYGVKPYLFVDSPLMYGGDRYLETSPKVYRIKYFRNLGLIIIEYSFGTSDFESMFKYENKKLIFIKHIIELAVD